MAEFDLEFLGDRVLERKLKRLEDKTQRKFVSRALRNEAKRLKVRVLGNLSGRIASPDSGRLIQAMRGAKITMRSRTRGGETRIRGGIVMPDRATLGIAGDDKYFYPSALEYGHRRAAAHPWARNAVDSDKEGSFARIAADLRADIEGFRG